MMRSLFTGISGLASHQVKMDVIADNIANVNTTGFKKSRVLFSNVLSETLKYPTSPKEDLGGTNGMQIGMGVKTASIDTINSQGALESTGRENDVAIQGDGYLVTWNGDRYVYSRAGALDIDAEGFLTLGSTGYRAYGWMAETLADGTSELNTNNTVGEINFLPGEKLPARSTTEIIYRSNLMATAEERRFAPENTLEYGTAPYKENITVKIDKVDDQTWNFSVRDNDGELIDLYSSPTSPDGFVNSTGTIKLFDDGRIENVMVRNPIAGGDDHISILSFSGNNDANQTVVGNAILDNFQIIAEPSDPPLVNYWTFKDQNGEEHEMTLKFNRDPDNASVWEWRVYDENNNLIDLDGFDNNTPEYTEDYGTVSFNDYGDITSITIANSATQGGAQISQTEPRYSITSTNYLSFTIPGYTTPLELSFNETGRRINLMDPATRAIREIPIASDRIKFQVDGTESFITFDAIKGAQHSTSLTCYDSIGTGHEVLQNFEKIADNTWRYSASLSMDDPIIERYLEIHPEAVSGDVATTAEKEAIMENIFWDPDEGNTRSGIIVFNTLGKVDIDATRTANNVNYPNTFPTLKFKSPGAKPVEIELDFDGVTQFDSAFTTAARSQNGYPMGMLESYNIDQYGTITGVYTNGHKNEMAQIALATFNNPSGLIKMADGVFMPSSNSGVALVGPATTGGRGEFVSGNLEMSNVDLAREFTDMIIAQRGFQANSKTITTADQLLQEVVNLKR